MTAAAAPDLAELLRRSAAEVRRCRDVVVELEDVVHALLDAGGAQVAAGPLGKLQAIDLLDQRLADLATWIDALSEAACACHPERPAEDLARQLRLDEMRRTLTGRTDTAPSRGEAEVF